MLWRGISDTTSRRIRWGSDKEGQPVFLKDIWPTQEEVATVVNSSIDSEMFRHQYSTVSDGDKNWQSLKFPDGETYGWEPDSTYIRKAPYFDGMRLRLRRWRIFMGRGCWRCWAIR